MATAHARGNGLFDIKSSTKHKPEHKPSECPIATYDRYDMQARVKVISDGNFPMPDVNQPVAYSKIGKHNGE